MLSIHLQVVLQKQGIWWLALLQSGLRRYSLSSGDLIGAVRSVRVAQDVGEADVLGAFSLELMADQLLSILLTLALAQVLVADFFGRICKYSRVE